MKKIRTFLAAGLILASFSATVFAEEQEATTEITKGPVETYVDCVESCVERTEPNSLRRVACASDCYIILVSDFFQLFR
ncbi:MAG: hypothetical protein JJU41_04300 [Bacteroidetes bacterium]|nr:hypothetical protein [Bacteroidota bacterium]MCH8523680.1 hypothetical protein [Balneolales bacterium]